MSAKSWQDSRVHFNALAEALILQGAYGLIVSLSDTSIEQGCYTRGEAAQLRSLLIDHPDTIDRYLGDVSEDESFYGFNPYLLENGAFE